MNMTAKNSNQTSDNNNCRCECKNPRKIVCEKDCICNSAKYVFETDKYLSSMIDILVTCKQIVETTKSILKKGCSSKKNSHKL